MLPPPSHRTIGLTDCRRGRGRRRSRGGEGTAALSVARPVIQSMADPTIDHEIGDGEEDGKAREDRRARERGLRGERWGVGAPL